MQKELMVNILFKEEGQEGERLQPGQMTLKDLYTGGTHTLVVNANGCQRYVSRRDFSIIDPSIPDGGRPLAIVCDIDGVLNYIPKNVDGTTNRQMVTLKGGRGETQWTELNATAQAEPRRVMFQMLISYIERGYRIVLLTARGDTQRPQTEKFLRDGFEAAGMDDAEFTVFMRGFSANDVGAPEMKAQMMQACILPNYRVELFIDDCVKNINMMKLTCPEVTCLHMLP